MAEMNQSRALFSYSRRAGASLARKKAKIERISSNLSRLSLGGSFTLELRLMRGKGLLSFNHGTSLCDPYAVIKIERTGEEHTTPACKKTNEPLWFHSLHFNEVLESDIIKLELWEKSIPNQRIGGSTFAVRDVLMPPIDALKLDSKKQKEFQTWIELKQERGIVSVVAVKRTGKEYSMEALAPQRAFSQFINKKYRSSIAGKIPFKRSSLGKMAKGVVSVAGSITGRIHPALEINSALKQTMRLHSTYAVKLSGIEEIFKGKMQSYNENYPAAKHIFEGRLSSVMKNALVVQHNYFYGKAIISSTLANIRKDFYLTSGFMMDGIDLGNLLQFGDRNGKSRVYTYVIIDDEFRFCECAAAFLKDIESKHAMHAAAKPEVVYAGEFHWKRNANNYALVIDNASGTYAPDKDDLPKVKELFQLNFPDIEILTYHYEDPTLIALKRNLSSEVLE